MKNTGPLDVNWLAVVGAGILLAISFSALKRCAVSGILSGVLYVTCQGIVALPFLTYFIAKTTKLVSVEVGIVIGLCAVAVSLIGLRLWQPYLSTYFEKVIEGKIQLHWTFIAASFGFFGMLLFFMEVGRILSWRMDPRSVMALTTTDPLSIALLKVGIAGAGLIMVQTLFMNLFAFTVDFRFDFVPYASRPSTWQWISFVLLSVGLIFSAMQKNPEEYYDAYAKAKKPTVRRPQPQVESMVEK